MPGYGGPYDNPAGQVEAYVTPRNTLTTVASASTHSGNPATQGFGNAASCPTPP
jgi:hypothetical protein